MRQEAEAKQGLSSRSPLLFIPAATPAAVPDRATITALSIPRGGVSPPTDILESVGLLVLLILALFGFAAAGIGSTNSGSGTAPPPTTSATHLQQGPRFGDRLGALHCTTRDGHTRPMPSAR